MLFVFTVALGTSRGWTLATATHLAALLGFLLTEETNRETPGRLATSESPSALVTQSYQIDSLSSDWLPAAYRPVRVSGAHGALYDASSSSLLTTPATAPGLRYWVQSLVPALTAAELRQARVDPNDPRLAPDLELPTDLPRSVVNLARQVVKRHSTPYGEALAPQDFFRDDFTCSLAPPPDDSVQALVRFLFVTRAGCCQQFAGAYAVMARAVGLPARVAVGFTPGQLGPGRPLPRARPRRPRLARGVPGPLWLGSLRAHRRPR
jgi:transglutaminase-like putative cysteine protease